MTDPIHAADTAASLNEDARDWAGPKTAAGIKLLATIIFPAIFVILCVVAGYLFATRKPASLLPAPVAAPAAAAPAASSNDKDAEIAALRSQLAALQAQSPAGSPGVEAAPVPLADASTLAQISARLDRVEARQNALAQAAAAANAAVLLQQAAHGDSPFVTQLAVVATTAEDPALIALLRPHAEKGVSSEAALAVDFPAAARLAKAAASDSQADNSLWGSVGRFLGGIISIRRTGDISGDGPEAILQRAETRLTAGDLRGAVAYLSRLPTPAQAALKPWLDKAQARLSVDDATRRLTESSLARLNRGYEAPATSGGVL